jgi:hypothetical protein
MTTRRRRVPDTSGQTLGNLIRTADWAGVTKGDVVEVSDTRLRSATWRFVAHVRNVVTGDEWIEVVGGRPGDSSLRSFPVSRVFAPTTKGKGKPRAPLAEAPRLPLD